MAKKGYDADPTLVSAAFRLGQSYIPKDYSSIFAKQYEGLIAGYKAKYEAIGEGVKSIGEETGKVLKRNTDVKDKRAEELDKLDAGLGFNDGLNTAATDYNTGVQEEQKTAYENNDQLPNKAVFDAEKEQFEGLKDQIEKLNKKGVFLGKKGKQERVDLIRSALKLRDYINETRGWDKAHNEGTRSLLIDQVLTHKDNPDLQFLLAEKTKKDGDLRDIGVTVFFDKYGKKQYRYPVGLGAQIYNKIQKDKGVEDSLLISPPEDQEYLTISEEQLYEGVVYKDDASRNTIRDGHVKEVTDAASELNATKNLAVKNYSDIKIRTKENIEATLEGSSSYQNLTNEGVLIGNTKVNWSKELNAGLAIDEIIVNQEGLGSDILTMADLDGDGIIDETEWEKLKTEKGKHSEARAQIIDKLLNPQTPQEKELSIDAYSEFISDKAEQVFNYTREQMGYVYNEENETWTMPKSGDPDWKRLGFSNIAQYEKHEAEKENYGKTKGQNPEITFQFKLPSGEYEKTTVRANELIEKDAKLNALMSQSSFDDESYVDIFGTKVGYFPGKGFAPVEIREDGQLTRKQLKKTKMPKGGYWKTPKDVFQNYSIPTTHSKGRMVLTKKEKEAGIVFHHKNGKPYKPVIRENGEKGYEPYVRS